MGQMISGVSEKSIFAGQGRIYNDRYKRILGHIHAADNLDQLLVTLRDKIADFFQAERVTIFMVDKKTNEIFSRVKTGKYPREIRVPINMHSIAGFVATTVEPVNIRNVYDEKELVVTHPELCFDRTWDKNSGYMTRQVLTIPIVGRASLLGIIQLVNKRNDAYFSSGDEKCLQEIAVNLGATFYNRYCQENKVPPQFEQLLENGILDEYSLIRAVSMAGQSGVNLETILLNEFNVPKNLLTDLLARYFGVPYDDLQNTLYNPYKVISGVKIEYFRKSFWVPLVKLKNTVLVALNQPDDQGLLQEIKKVYRNVRVELRFSLQQDIERFLDSDFNCCIPADAEPEEAAIGSPAGEAVLVPDPPPRRQKIAEDAEIVNDRNIVQLAGKIIEDAYNRGASDIHLEPGISGKDAAVRYRIDGSCVNVMSIPGIWSRAVVSRIKILANLDISERRKPQDGKIKFKTSGGENIELRAVTVPTAENNEDVVLRVLADSKPLPLDKIMPASTFERFKPLIMKPYGIVMVVGPTGSGKTTTLHSALGFINKPERKIWTAEDPVEITQAGLRQVQVNPKIGYTFAAAMRAFLRADPDVIMVGEMRDRETVGIGIEASLTGHLVFSTLHTNSAPETVTRLIDMGMDPFNFADALLGVLAQRLTRSLCPACRQSYRPGNREYEHLKELYGAQFTAPPETLRLNRLKGCSKCDNVGYKGRIGLYELLVNNDTMRKAIIQRATVSEIRELSVGQGMVTLLQDGINRILAGDTDLSQVLSVCSQ